MSTSTSMAVTIMNSVNTTIETSTVPSESNLFKAKCALMAEQLNQHEQLSMTMRHNEGGSFKIDLAFGTVIGLGVFANVAVIAAVINSKAIKNIQTIFIMHLALSDLLLSGMTAPLTRYMHTRHFWYWGRWSCKAVASTQALNMFVSSLTLAAIALSRLHIINKRTLAEDAHWRRNTVLSLAAIWIASTMCVLPYTFAVTTLPIYGERGVQQITECGLPVPERCEEDPRSWIKAPFYPIVNNDSYTIVVFLIQYAVPLFACAGTYTYIVRKLRKRLDGRFGSITARTVDNVRHQIARHRTNRSTMLLFSIVALFAISWLPFNVYNVYIIVMNPKPEDRWQDAHLYCNLIGLCTPMVDPILYGVFNEQFRQSFMNLINAVLRKGTCGLWDKQFVAVTNNMSVGGGQSIVAGTKYVLVSSIAQHAPTTTSATCPKTMTAQNRRMTNPTLPVNQLATGEETTRMMGGKSSLQHAYYRNKTSVAFRPTTNSISMDRIPDKKKDQTMKSDRTQGHYVKKQNCNSSEEIPLKTMITKSESSVYL